jgi:hypothetical protein
MKEHFRRFLEGIDPRLPSYFLVKGGRLQVVPPTANEYANLLKNGYEPLVEAKYDELDRGVILALNEILNELGQRSLLLFPFAVSAILAHEAGREGSPLHKALKGVGAVSEAKEAKEDRKQKRKRE